MDAAAGALPLPVCGLRVIANLNETLTCPTLHLMLTLSLTTTARPPLHEEDHRWKFICGKLL